MSYTEAQVRAFVADAVIAGSVRPQQLIAEGEQLGIDPEAIAKAAKDLREAGWIEWISPYYHICPQGLICRGLLPASPLHREPVQVFDLRVSETGIVERCLDSQGSFSRIYTCGKLIEIRDKGVK